MPRALKPLRRFPNSDQSYTFRGTCQECGARGKLHRYVQPGTEHLVWGCGECEQKAADARGFVKVRDRGELALRSARVIEALSW